MRVRATAFAAVLIAVLLAGGAWFLFGFQISALRKPSRAESFLANAALHWFVSREDSQIPASTPDSPENVSDGKAMFVNECGLCHGSTGRRPTQMGRSLHPPAPPLDTPGVQQWSNRELFWVTKNGIRNTGMPGFARIHSDSEIWHIIDYIRSLDGRQSSAAPEGRLYDLRKIAPLQLVQVLQTTRWKASLGH